MTSKFRNDIQGLRALAVMLVVIYHSGINIFPGGYVGVDVFFVISGFLIAGSLIKELETTGKIAFANFYARRARRLLPAAVFVLLFVIVIFRFYYSPLELKQFSSSAVATAAYLSNFWFAHLATDYLAHNANPNPLLHTWSLSVEEQFYFIWPLLLLGFYKLARKSATASLVGGTIAVSIISFVACVLLTAHSQPWAFFICLTRFWEFGLGALTAVYLQKHSISNRIISNSGAVIGISLIIIPAFWFSSMTIFPSGWALLPVLGTCLLLLFISETNTQFVYHSFANRYTQFIGDISYSLYLWHWPVFVLLGMLGFAKILSFKLLGIGISVLLATLTYYLIENPIRFNRRIASSTVRSYFLAATLSCVALIASFVVRQEAAEGLREPFQQRLLNVQKSLPLIYEDNCHASFFEVVPSPCEYGEPNAKETVVLFGDSHAAHWFPALNAIAKSESWRLITFTKSSCPSINFEPFASHLGRRYKECTIWRKAVFAQLRDIKPDRIIISNSYDYARVDSEIANQWEAATLQTLDQIRREDIDIYIIKDTPKLKFDAPNCLSRAHWLGRDSEKMCAYELADSMMFAADKSEVAALNRSSDTHRIDLTSHICNEAVCQVQQEPHIIFNDNNHLTVEFVESLTNELKERLRSSRP